MQPLVVDSGDIVIIGYALGDFFFFFPYLNVLSGVYVAQPDPFLFANTMSHKNLIIINMAELGETIQTTVQQGRVVHGQAAPRGGGHGVPGSIPL